MSRAQQIQDASGRILYHPGRGTYQAWGTGVGASNTNGTPINGTTGFAPGCIWHNPQGIGGTSLYVNVGTFTSSQWVNLDGPSILPVAKYTTQAYQTATFAAGDITGAGDVYFENTGLTPGTLTTRTATQMFADIPGCFAGYAYSLAVRNSAGGANTLTFAAGSGVTTTGTLTVAQNVTRFFCVTFTSSTACTINSMGTGAANV